MPEPPANVYAVVHRALLWGMVASTALYAAGVLRALQHPAVIPLDHAYQLGWSQTWRGLAALDPTSLMLAATVLLILTPVARVALACLAFARDRDRAFVAVTGAVLGVIALTVVLGRLGLH
ncbi:MAG: DUF1634 domain-containing protein [Terriglobales bacterium]